MDRRKIKLIISILKLAILLLVIVIKGDTAIINGVRKLDGVSVRATDLRAGAALILAGLSASGETRIEDMVHVWRGYEAIDRKLRGLGASVSLEEGAER